jgi:hypothetical protein
MDIPDISQGGRSGPSMKHELIVDIRILSLGKVITPLPACRDPGRIGDVVYSSALGKVDEWR